MANQNHENQNESKFQTRNEWTDKLKDLIENVPEGVDFLIVTSGEVEDKKTANVIAAGGTPPGIMSSITIAMNKSAQIIPPSFYDLLKRRESF